MKPVWTSKSTYSRSYGPVHSEIWTKVTSTVNPSAIILHFDHFAHFMHFRLPGNWGPRDSATAPPIRTLFKKNEVIPRDKTYHNPAKPVWTSKSSYSRSYGPLKSEIWPKVTSTVNHSAILLHFDHPNQDFLSLAKSPKNCKKPKNPKKNSKKKANFLNMRDTNFIFYHDVFQAILRP